MKTDGGCVLQLGSGWKVQEWPVPPTTLLLLFLVVLVLVSQQLQKCLCSSQSLSCRAGDCGTGLGDWILLPGPVLSLLPLPSGPQGLYCFLLSVCSQQLPMDCECPQHHHRSQPQVLVPWELGLQGPGTPGHWWIYFYGFSDPWNPNLFYICDQKLPWPRRDICRTEVYPQMDKTQTEISFRGRRGVRGTGGYSNCGLRGVSK